MHFSDFQFLLKFIERTEVRIFSFFCQIFWPRILKKSLGIFWFEISTHKITHFYTKEFLPASFLLTRRHIKSRAHICSSKKIVKTVLPDCGGFSRIFFFQLLFDFQIFSTMDWAAMRYLILLLNIFFHFT